MRRRATGLVLALLTEGLLIVILLLFGQKEFRRSQGEASLSTFDVAPPQAAQEEQEKHRAPEVKELQKSQARPPEPKTPDTQPEPEVALPSLIPLSQRDLAALDIANIAPRPRVPPPARAVAGPSAAGIPGDTPLMAGTGPNGEPLYAAQWYREPTDRELSGYLSSADGPGWGLIACKTEPEYRVDQCVILGEYPTGSRIANAVLQASWQFRVRPPRKGGKSLIGEWVGIRIDYGVRHR